LYEKFISWCMEEDEALLKVAGVRHLDSLETALSNGMPSAE